MKKLSLFITLYLCLLTQSYAVNENRYPFPHEALNLRFQALTASIRCVVCQNQNIADSNAPLANDLREKVYQLIMANQSDQAIKDYLVERYGEFILLEPRFNKLTVFLWTFPFLLLALMVMVLLRFVHNKK